MQQICYEYEYKNESRHSLQTYAFRRRNISIRTPGRDKKMAFVKYLTNAIFSDYRFEGRYIVDGPSIKSPSFLSRGTYFSSDNVLPPAPTTTR